MTDDQNPLQGIYFLTQDIQSYLAEYYGTEARDQFVEDLAEYLQTEQNVPDSVISEMIAEKALEEVVADLIDHIENNSVSMIGIIGEDGIPDSGLHFPIYSKSPVGSIYTLDKNSYQYSQGERKQPTESFYTALTKVVSDDEEDAGWGSVPEEVFDEMKEYERQVFGEIAALLVEGQLTRELVWLLEMAEEKVENKT